MDPRKARRLRHKAQRKKLADLLEKHPDASLVANKYRAIRAIIASDYSGFVVASDGVTLEHIVDDSIALNREWQWLTEGKDKKNKVRLEQEFFQGRLRSHNGRD